MPSTNEEEVSLDLSRFEKVILGWMLISLWFVILGAAGILPRDIADLPVALFAFALGAAALIAPGLAGAGLILSALTEGEEDDS